MTEIECFFDCGSPWTYLAFHNLPERSQQSSGRRSRGGRAWSAACSTRSIPACRHSRDHPVVRPSCLYAKKIYRIGRIKLGMRIIFPPTVFPVNSVKAMRGCCWLEARGQAGGVRARGVRGVLGRRQGHLATDVLASICRRIGVDPDAFFAAIERQANKDRLRNNTQELIDRGGFGSPTMFVGGEDMYFGNDRLPLVRAALQRRRGLTNQSEACTDRIGRARRGARHGEQRRAAQCAGQRRQARTR
jgi:2-hydroxychromene-2-carboxylate isomerase